MRFRMVTLVWFLVGPISAQSITSSQSTMSTASTITSSADTSSSNNGIQSLLSEAESLLSSYLPLTTLLSGLTLPVTVALSSSTYTVSPTATTLSTSSSPVSMSSAEPTSSAFSSPAKGSMPTQTLAANNLTSSSSGGQASSHSDKRLGIGLGVGLGCIALGVLIAMIWLLKRRKRLAAKHSLNRSMSPSRSDAQPWKTPVSYASDTHDRYSTAWGHHLPTMAATNRPPTIREDPRLSEEFIDGSGSDSDRDPLQPRYESYAELATENSRQHSRTSSAQELHGESSMMRMLNHDDRAMTPITRAALAAVEPHRRPHVPTVEVPSDLVSSPVSPILPTPAEAAADGPENHGFWRSSLDNSHPYPQPNHTIYHESARPSICQVSSVSASSSNPFASEEDEDWVGSQAPPLPTRPPVPERSPKRQSLSAVHYPSGSEISTFHFGLDARRHWESEEHVDGGDGWRAPFRARESVEGRYEMQ